MSEHYTSNTYEADGWCNHCKRITQHDVSGNRLGRCREHNTGGANGLSQQQQKRKTKREREEKEPRLFQ
jgi:hypothetical protein